MEISECNHYLSLGEFHRYLRMQAMEMDPEGKRFALKLPYRTEYSRTDKGDYHGGILAAVLDVAGTFVSSAAIAGPATTVNLNVSYLKPPSRCDLVVTARVLKRGRRLVFTDVEARDESGTLYAIARGMWSAPQAGGS